VGPVFTRTARRLGIVSALGTVLLSVLYGGALIAGLAGLSSPQQPIGDPVFAVLEVLIILMAPLMVALMAVAHAWASPEDKTLSLIALVFMSLLAGLTCGIHFVILTVGRQTAIAGLTWMPLFLSFHWPSVSYALDILAWDVFFALSVLFAAPVFRGGRLATSIRWLLAASGVLALGGLSGVVFSDMRLRDIGIVGYCGVFPVAALLLAILFRRSEPVAPTPTPDSCD